MAWRALSAPNGYLPLFLEMYRSVGQEKKHDGTLCLWRKKVVLFKKFFLRQIEVFCRRNPSPWFLAPVKFGKKENLSRDKEDKNQDTLFFAGPRNWFCFLEKEEKGCSCQFAGNPGETRPERKFERHPWGIGLRSFRNDITATLYCCIYSILYTCNKKVPFAYLCGGQLMRKVGFVAPTVVLYTLH